MSSSEPAHLPAPYVHPTAFAEEGAILEPGVKVWHFCHVRKGAHLEAGVSVGKDSYIDADVRVQKGSRIQNGVSVFKGVHIGPWCFVGPAVVFTNDMFPRVGNKSWQIVSTELKTGCSIGAGAIIRCGITLGEFSMVAAGAVVTKSVPPFHLAMGLPAEATKKICACGQTVLPLETPYTDLMRDCCRENMDPEIRKEADQLLEGL